MELPMLKFRVRIVSGLSYDVEATDEDSAKIEVCRQMLEQDNKYFSRFTIPVPPRKRTKIEHYFSLIKTIECRSQ